MTRTACGHCRTEFDVESSAKYCSVRCRSAVNRAKSRAKELAKRQAAHAAKRFICAHCSERFSPPYGRGHRWKYCSALCERGSNELRNQRHVWSRYRLSEAEYLALLREQGNRCLICTDEMHGFGREPAAPQIDHCHTSGIVRGVLCRRCNTGLGQFRDDPRIIERALRYLNR